MSPAKGSFLVIAVLLHSLATPVAAQERTWDGLVLQEDTELDAVYLRPRAEFSRYRQVLLEDVVVIFDESLDSLDEAALAAADPVVVSSSVAEEFESVLTETLRRGGGLRLATEPGASVMSLTAIIMGLKLEILSTGGYVVDATELALVAELRDSRTGTPLARAVDSVETPEEDRYTWAADEPTSPDLKRAFERWAEAIRRGMDRIRSTAGIG